MITTILMLIMGAGFIIGGVDTILNDRWKLSTEFKKGLGFMGTATVTMAGFMCLAPIFAAVLTALIDLAGGNIIFGIDPAMVASVLNINQGGYPTAIAIADDPLLGQFAGIIVCSMLGNTIIFTIPSCMGVIGKEDHEFFARGLLIGLIPVPIGAFVSGIMMDIEIGTLLLNLIPVILLAILMILGLTFIPKQMTAGFVKVARVIQLVGIIGLTIAGFTKITGYVVIPMLDDITSAMAVIAAMCFVMAGSFVVMELFMRAFKKSLQKFGSKFGLNAITISGMLISLLSMFPTFAMMKDMNPKGKIVCTAFFVAGGVALGGHMSYTAVQEPDVLIPMIVGKLLAGGLAVVLALIIESKRHDKIDVVAEA